MRSLPPAPTGDEEDLRGRLARECAAALLQHQVAETSSAACVEAWQQRKVEAWKALESAERAFSDRFPLVEWRDCLGGGLAGMLDTMCDLLEDIAGVRGIVDRDKRDRAATAALAIRRAP